MLASAPNTGLRITNLSVVYRGDNSAVTNVSFEIESARSFCLIGESAAGKSSIAGAILRVLPASAKVTGDLYLGSNHLSSLSEREMLQVRRKKISLIPQDARGSLIPHTQVGRQIQRIISVRLELSKEDSESYGREQLSRVGMGDIDRVWRSVPGELSGGMCQRVLLALAISSQPELLIADEPLTSVDAPAQVELLHLLMELHDTCKFVLLIITHDIRIASRFDEIGVLQNGRLVEVGLAQQVLSNPKHPYTKSIVDAGRELSSTVFKESQK